MTLPPMATTTGSPRRTRGRRASPRRGCPLRRHARGCAPSRPRRRPRRCSRGRIRWPLSKHSSTEYDTKFPGVNWLSCAADRVTIGCDPRCLAGSRTRATLPGRNSCGTQPRMLLPSQAGAGVHMQRTAEPKKRPPQPSWPTGDGGVGAGNPPSCAHHVRSDQQRLLRARTPRSGPRRRRRPRAGRRSRRSSRRGGGRRRAKPAGLRPAVATLPLCPFYTGNRA